MPSMLLHTTTNFPKNSHTHITSRLAVTDQFISRRQKKVFTTRQNIKNMQRLMMFWTHQVPWKMHKSTRKRKKHPLKRACFNSNTDVS